MKTSEVQTIAALALEVEKGVVEEVDLLATRHLETAGELGHHALFVLVASRILAECLRRAGSQGKTPENVAIAISRDALRRARE